MTAPSVRRDSELEELARLILPRIKGVVLQDLTDKQADFLSKDAETPVEHIQALVSASKLIQAAKELALRNEADIGDLEFPLLASAYAWQRIEAGLDLKSALERGETWWLETLAAAIGQGRIPETVEASKKRVIALLTHLRAWLKLEPAGEGLPSSLGDILGTLPGPLRLKPEEQRLVSAALDKDPRDLGKLKAELKAKGLESARINGVLRTIELGEITSKHASMAKALQPFAAKSEGHTLAGLALIETDRWLDLACEHGVPPSSHITPEEYAADLEQAVESREPTAVLAAKLQSGAIVLERAAFSGVSAVLTKHPTFDISRDDVEVFVQENDIHPDTGSAIGKLQHLKRLDARWTEAAALVNAGLDSVGQITPYSPDQFKTILRDWFPEERLLQIYDKAVALRAVSIGLMGYLQPFFNGVTPAVMKSFNKADPTTKKQIDSSPTLRKLFGALESCACDPYMSVLSPAAYLADLLKFIDASHEAGRELRRRRSDIYDLDLSCDNTKIELPQIDLAIEILESAVAFPCTILLPAGTNALAELKSNPIGGAIRDALSQTATEPLGDLSAQPDEWTVRPLIYVPGVSHWVVTDRHRRWVLKATTAFFGLASDITQRHGLIYNAEDLRAAIKSLDHSEIPTLVLKDLYPALAKIVSEGLPADIQINSVKQFERSRRWQLNFLWSCSVSLDFSTGLVHFSGAASSTTSGPYSTKMLQRIKHSLDAGTLPKLLPWITKGRSVSGLNVKATASGWLLEVYAQETLIFNPASLEVQGLSYQSTLSDRDLFVRPQNRNPLAYGKLSGPYAFFPWSLPYDHNLAEIRETLRVADASRLSLLEQSSSAVTRNSSYAIARERLGLSKGEWDCIVTSRIDGSNMPTAEFWRSWGLGITASSQKAILKDTFIDQDVEANPFGQDGLLTRVSIVLQQARLSFAELSELLQSDFINPGGAVHIEPDSSCKPSDMRLQGVTPPCLDRLHSFVRLWRITGWEVWEVDLALESQGIGNKILDENALVQIANLGLLRERLSLSVDVLAAMFGGFRHKQYSQVRGGAVRNIIPLYDRLFQDRRLADPPLAALAFNESLNKVLPPGNNTSIAACLGLRGTDLSALLDADSRASGIDPAPLDPDIVIAHHSLAWVFRNAALARALGLSLEDYARAWRLLSGIHFISPGNLLSFLDDVQFIQQSGFSWSELEYILQGDDPKKFEHGLAVQRAAEVLSGLQRELRQLDTPVQVTEAEFRFKEDDLKAAKLPAAPTSAQARFKEHWGLKQVVGGSDWSVIDPSDATKVLEGSPLDLLARVDVLAQQAKLTPVEIKSAVTTSFVDSATPQTLSITTSAGNEIVSNLTAAHLDRLERFLFMLNGAGMKVAELDILLQVFCNTAVDPLQWDLTKVVKPAIAILALRDRLGLSLQVIIGWWGAGSTGRAKSLADALGISTPEIDRLQALFKAEPTNDDPWAETYAFLKRRAELAVQYLAQAMSIDPALAGTILWNHLHTPAGTSRPAIQCFVSSRFTDPKNNILSNDLRTTEEFSNLVRLHKFALLSAKWNAKVEELPWLPGAGFLPAFAGLSLDALPTPQSTPSASTSDWISSTTLMQLAHTAPAMSSAIGGYLDAFQRAEAGKESQDARAALKDPLGFAGSSTAVDACAAKLGIVTKEQHLEPLQLAELMQLLSSLQRLGINETQLSDLTAEAPGQFAIELSRKLLRPRFGDSGWQQALKEVSNALRPQQRDRLVDYLLSHEGLADANALYGRYLIDIEMSACLNTTRLLQSTAAAQLFVQRCLFNLEKGVPPESIDRKRWEWMQNYRVWEANRKVFLYPENWLFPEVRDDRTETFRAFESALTQSEPSHENAVKALRQYLDDLVEVSQISVMGMYEHAEEMHKRDKAGNPIIRHTLYLVGRSPNPPHKFYWRTAMRFGEPGMRWTGWERIDQNLSGDHVIPFVFEGDFYLAWPTIRQVDRDGSTYSQVQMVWSRLTTSGWTKRQVSKESSREVKKLSNRDERSLFTFRCNIDPENRTVNIDAYSAKPKDPSEPLPMNPNIASFSKTIGTKPPGNYPWYLNLALSCFVKYTGDRIAKVADVAVKIYGLDVVTGVYAGDPNNYPYKNYSGPGPIYRPATNPTTFVDLGSKTFLCSTRMVPGDYNLTVEVTAFGKKVAVLVDPFQAGKWDLAAISANVLFTDVQEPDTFATDPTAPLNMEKFATFTIFNNDESSWKDATNLSIVPLKNSYAWSSGFRERGQGGVGFLKPGFPEAMYMTSANGKDNMSAVETWYIEEGSRKLIMKIEERNFVNRVYPAGYSEALLYKAWGTDSPDRLFDKTSQDKGENTWFNVDDINGWIPIKIPRDPRDNKSLAFELLFPNANYNWEVFYHLPLAAAIFLSRQHRFEDARRWFHFIFDPTTDDSNTGPERFWSFLPFRNAQVPATITQILETLANPDAPSNQKEEVKQQIAAWLDDPFNPFAVARLRPGAFEWYTVIAYIKNLFGWADQLFRRDTRESINEATLLYILAAQILGPRPEEIRARGATRTSLSYRAMEGKWDDYSNTWITLADNPLTLELLINAMRGAKGKKKQEGGLVERLSSIGSLYFCVPPNEKLSELWDQVEDRLFKIRHCQNIEGVIRSLPLFEPPIDPELLIRAKAAGLDLADVLSERFAPLPHYRFQVLLQKANEFCNEVKSLGGALLSAIEKKEAEHLSLLRSRQEIDMLKLIESIKAEQVKEAQANIDSLKKAKLNAIDRFAFLQRQLGENQITFDASGSPIVSQSLIAKVQETGSPDGFRSLSLIQSEIDQINYMELSNVFSVIAGVHRFSAGVTHLVGLYPPAKNPAEAVGFALSATADGFSTLAGHLGFLERRSSQMGGWQRRRDEWVQQSKMAAGEIRQIDKQIAALEIRKSIAERELENHRQQIEHASNIDDYLRHMKFTSKSLHAWMESQLAGLYFSAYQIAYDLAKRAERVYRFELGDENTSFVRFGHWDNMRKGLLSGDRLSQDLRRMEAAYLDKNKREYEITKHVSVMSIDPVALLQLKATGQCEVSLPEDLFDLDHPGGYMRKIKSVSVSIPCITGPYTSVNCKLTLLKSMVRRKNTLLNGNQYKRDDNNDDSRFTDEYGAIESVVTSSAQMDSGLFETNLRDERYLPFEGRGAISTWRIELPSEFRLFDYNTISDVILHMRYTAREGGSLLKSGAVSRINEIVKDVNASGLRRLFSLRHDFPPEWHHFVTSKINEDFKAVIKKDYFPYIAQSFNVQVGRIDLFTIKGTLTQVNTNIDLTVLSNNINDKTKNNQSELTIPKANVDKDAQVLLVFSYSLTKAGRL